MVPGLLRDLSRPLHGHVYASSHHRWIRWLECSRVYHANGMYCCTTAMHTLTLTILQYFNAVLYASAPELFDTSYRGSVSGMLSCMGRLAGIVAPYAGAQFLAAKSSGILWLGAGGIWLSALVMVFLPVEMRNRQMF